MDKKKNGIPKLRFPGFTGAWEQRKLGEVSPLRGGFAFKSAEFCESGVPVVRISNIQSEGIVGGKFIYYPEQKNDTNYLLPDKSAVIAMSGATTGKVAILMNLKSLKVYQNQRVGYFTRKKGVNYDFVSVLIRSSMFLKQLNSVLVAGAQPNVSSKDVDGFVFLIPSDIREQQKIGKLFQQLDSLIALHQRKLDHLKEQKKGLLQKMFSKKGEVVPEVRFPGFTNAWEQRKLGEVAKRVTRKNKNLESTLPLTISAQLGLVDQISYFDKRIASLNLSNYILLKKGEFAYNKSYSNGYPFGAVKRLNDYDKGVIPSLYIAFDPDNIQVESNFMETYFETSLWHKEVSTRASEGARNHGLLNISPTDFMDINLMVPKLKEEQILISNFMHNFDALITLHQRKLDHLKLLKKGLLQQMFV